MAHNTSTLHFNLINYGDHPNTFVSGYVDVRDFVGLRWRIQECLFILDNIKLARDWSYTPQLDTRIINGNCVEFLYKLTEFSVHTASPVEGINRETVELICACLCKAMAEKIKDHETEHKELGSHWGTATEWYRFNPAKYVRPFYRLHLKDEPTRFNTDYTVRQDEDDTVFTLESLP